ncbi:MULTISPECIES: tail protein X [unclassified Acidocella]|uniref:tail protein X n=1 Tax=unclassified Acidocella TaxID=2648610 RepID=UPI00028CA82E|nr:MULTISPECIES: tail protein X [unclassified Acidocella]EKN00985.1 putative phage tail protein [Acidocella sp. MX-AZ02]WBO60535.1 tail protein X [Acidocella sp. MX-AZ03]
MAAVTYTTKDGDVVDAVAFAYYGTLDGRVYEQVLAANPGLAALGPVLGAGVVITLPDLSASVGADQGVRLWS